MPDYDLEKRLGNGAFGEVWLGDDRALGVRRAIKFIPPHNINNPTNFYKEPQTLMSLKHNNVIEITDAGTTPDGKLYIAMVYYPKGSLEDVIKGSIVPLEESLKIISDVCRGLEYIHSLDYIHRDIKPANIIMDETNNARLSDFGLATKLDISGTASPYGYIGHLAPEVITDDITDKRTDIYALGVTLYRLVNGDAYIPMVDAMELVDMIKEGVYPNRNKFRPFIPTPIKNIINKAISVDPKNRFQSASEFRHAIEKVKIYASWMPKTIQNGTEWNCKVGKMNFTIKSIRKSQGCFDLEFFKGNEGKTQKKIKDESSSCDSKLQHDKKLKNLLNRIVLKGK
ncbi:serine/threonine-protein kinase [Chryseobacterium rhizosphaerae]|uniref:serine/threonine-protein kinase n=1 Tax=Chryseobacterium rhizosphaerae TaxID=395937 RepID=UPI0028576C6D|nr:serine/threonine-protein kinase [Chryseobacterium rhizosphaerae]MDR6546569.1 serine/threonine-protein kinase [Chryseobacterium rhizosphaerae]